MNVACVCCVLRQTSNSRAELWGTQDCIKCKQAVVSYKDYQVTCHVSGWMFVSSSAGETAVSGRGASNTRSDSQQRKRSEISRSATSEPGHTEKPTRSANYVWRMRAFVDLFLYFLFYEMASENSLMCFCSARPRRLALLNHSRVHMFCVLIILSARCQRGRR